MSSGDAPEVNDVPIIENEEIGDDAERQPTANDTVESNEPAPPQNTVQPSDSTVSDHKSNTTVNVQADASENFQAIGSQVVNYYTETRTSSPSRLKLNSFQSFSKQAVENRCRGVSFHENRLSAAVELLERNRVLLISGEPEVGKGAFAFSVANIVLNNAPQGRLFLHRNFERTINFDFKDLRAPQGTKGPYVVVLKDAFVRGNRSLSRLGESLDEDLVKEWGDILTPMECYLVLTSDESLLPDIWTGGSRAFRTTITPQDYNDPIAAIIAQFSKADADWVQEAATTIFNRLKTLPRSISFVQEYVEQLLKNPEMIDIPANIDRALSQFENLERWLLEELLESHPAAWCFAMATVIGAADKTTQGFPWIDAYELARGIAKQLRRLHPGWDRERKALALHSEMTLLGPARLETVAGESQTEAQLHLVAFKDTSYEQRLWDVLTHHGRPLLADLIPLLRSLLEHESPDLRLAAASSLGRIGEIDGGGVIYPIIRHLARSEDWRDYASLGYLLVGALSTENDPYIHAIVNATKKYTINDRRRRMAPFMLAMREVAFIDLPFAVDGVLQAVEKHLIRSFVKFDASERDWDNFVMRLSSAVRDVGLWMDADARKTLRGVAALDSAEQAFDKHALEVIAWATYSLTGMCLGRSPAEVAAAVNVNLRGADKQVVAVAAFLIFKGGGVFDTLEGHPLYVDLDNRRYYANTSRVVVALTDDPDSAADFADYVIDAYDAFGSLSGTLSRWHRNLLLAFLEHWAFQAAVTISGTNAMSVVLKRIVSGPNTALATAVSSFLRGGLFAKAGTPHADMATEIRLSM